MNAHKRSTGVRTVIAHSTADAHSLPVTPGRGILKTQSNGELTPFQAPDPHSVGAVLRDLLVHLAALGE